MAVFHQWHCLVKVILPSAYTFLYREISSFSYSPKHPRLFLALSKHVSLSEEMATLRPATMISMAPRHYLFTQSSAVQLSRRAFSSSQSSRLRASQITASQFKSGPAPPRLPKEDQEIFEALQKQSTGAFSTPRQPPKINQSPDSTSIEVDQAEAETTQRAEKMADSGTQASFKEEFDRVIEARGKGEELHPNVRRGSRPEFEGETNPKTGEVGGPKNEPLRWGAAGEWSYNGRTTDF